MVVDKRIYNLKSGNATAVSLEEVFAQTGIDVILHSNISTKKNKT